MRTMRCFGSSGAVFAGSGHDAQQGTGRSEKMRGAWCGLCAVAGGAARGGTGSNSVRKQDVERGLEDSFW